MSTAWSPWTCTRRSSRASSTCPSTTCTRCPRCATRSRPRPSPISWSSRPTPASPRGRVRTRSGWACRTRSPTRNAPTTPRPRDMLDLIGDVDGKTALIVDDFTITAGSLVDAARIVSDRGAAQIYAMVEPRPAHGDRGRAAGRQPDRAARSSPTPSRPSPSRSPTRSRSSRSPRSSARRSAASTAARASASCVEQTRRGRIAARTAASANALLDSANATRRVRASR